ncbi:PQQ-dependent sugar dehydrogenase [Pseudomonas rhizoryzae]|uniref:PQQ-dependent sugar dehydrogenase n=1 Tax=Pseudomonas rhizoryzae TaxID=2571129 RepID=UPI0007365792|nr:PQQ-dependent sugar dehydrogenase [Pseudomonas rhizoryzae]KTT24508.1 glucose dehydrogenase [Pseudomonas psychrotolerans]KTT34045.1 glucose dehydrogenase [Pseudomonas psychrotolerans]KTT58273.1 glucose dehydrogenase [Pseudomonas psychrotolerans]KTT76610.1 glucose dehydrogenase [Pseudomonas psychrotolerans]
MRGLTLAAGSLLLGLATLNATAAPQALSQEQWPFTATPRATLDAPWAIAFLPDGTALVTEKGGALKHLNVQTGKAQDISGVPKVVHAGQGGLGDVILHPQYASNHLIYLSYAEAGEGGTQGAAVARAKLSLKQDGSGSLSELKVIWRQTPKVTGNGHYGHRMRFGPDGKLWITSGERQKFTPAQDMSGNLGKLIRLNDDGSIPQDNPFAKQGGVAAQVWSLGHRNPLGIAFDAQGRLWEQEMGPQGGDELNLIQRGGNYGYPEVSNGDHYGGKPIPDHDTRPEFIPPKITWTPVISPAGLMIYEGNRFPAWKGNAFIGGLSSKSLVRIELKGEEAREVERYAMGTRIRDVEEGPNGSLWVLEDGANARLLELQPK